MPKDPLLSTYLNLRLSHIFWQVADDDLALSSLRSSGHRSLWCSRGCLTLLDTRGWCSDGDLGLGFSIARTTATESAAAAGLRSVLHDLVEGLVELSRHRDGVVVCGVGKWWFLAVVKFWLK